MGMVMQDQVTPTEKRPLVSVCIANYNGIELIGPCIDSVLNQQTSCRIEVLVHDDASTDNSSELIKTKYSHVKLIESHTNVGYCISNNILAKEANGNYLLFLNNDATLFPDAIQTLVEYAEAANNPCILGLPQYDMETSELIDRGALFDFFLNPVANKDQNRTHVGMVIGACLWIPKAIWDETEGFPQWFESLAEDMYLCINALLRGYDVCVPEKSGYSHLVGSSFGGGKLKNNKISTTYKRRKLSERNKCFVMFIFFPKSMLYLLLPIHLIILFLEGMSLAVIKLDISILKDIYLSTFTSLWNKRRFLLEKRSELQPRRKISLRNFLSYFVYYPFKLKILLRHGLPSLK